LSVSTRKRIASIRHPEAGGPEESPVKRQRGRSLGGAALCAGINRHVVGGASPLQERK
jgi:hypothetical protein